MKECVEAMELALCCFKRRFTIGMELLSPQLGTYLEDILNLNNMFSVVEAETWDFRGLRSRRHWQEPGSGWHSLLSSCIVRHICATLRGGWVVVAPFFIYMEVILLNTLEKVKAGGRATEKRLWFPWIQKDQHMTCCIMRGSFPTFSNVLKSFTGKKKYNLFKNQPSFQGSVSQVICSVHGYVLFF